MKRFFLINFIVVLFIGCAFIQKMPQGTNVKSKTYYADINDVDFLSDLTYKKEGIRVSEQEIFDTLFVRIDQAQEYILIDMFLFNSFIGKEEVAYRNLADELTNNIIKKKKELPSIKIDVITDPINSAYGGGDFHQGNKMDSLGVNIIYTKLSKMRDSNHIYAPIWRTFIQWFGNSKNSGIFPHPFSPDEPKVSLRTYFSLLNFKANHRKVFISDKNEKMTAILLSANPHDGSSAHSNVAVEVTGNLWEAIYLSEKAVADFSNSKLQTIPKKFFSDENKIDDYKINLITERHIRDKILSTLNTATQNEVIDIGMFYLSDRKVVKSLISASKRNVKIRLILDPSKDAFGRQKSGIPNRQVAAELVKKSDNKIKIRWFDTHGEQFHTKFLYAKNNNGEAKLIIGSANFTKRNIGNYNLESNLLIAGKSNLPLFLDVETYYSKIWNNKENNYTADFSKYEEHKWFKNMRYRFYEFFGANTF